MKKKPIKFQRKQENEAAKGRTAELERIELKYISDKNKLNTEASNQKKAIWTDEYEYAKSRITEEGNLVKKQVQEDIEVQQKKLKNNEISIKQYTENVKKIEEDAAKDELRAKVSQAKKELEIQSVLLNPEEREALQQSLTDLEIELSNKETDVYISNNQKKQESLEQLKQATEEYLSGFSKDFISNSPLKSLSKFADGSFSKLFEGAKLFDEQFEKAKANGEDVSRVFSQKFAVSFNAIADGAKEAFDFIGQISQQKFEEQLQRLDAEKEYQLQFAGDNAAAKEEIERQFEAKRAEIQKKQAKAQKKQAIFNAVINTGQAIVSTLAQAPGGAISKGLQAAIVGALGAAQIAAIVAQPIPQFWQGGIVGGEQQIMVNDDPYGKKGRNYKEVIQKPNGQTLFPQGRNVKMTVPNGTIVHPTYEAFLSSLNDNLTDNAIVPVGLPSIAPNVHTQGLTKGEVMEVMHHHANSLIHTINNQNGVHVNIDENGINKYISKKQSTKKILNARFSGVGRSV